MVNIDDDDGQDKDDQQGDSLKTLHNYSCLSDYHDVFLTLKFFWEKSIFESQECQTV